MLPEILIANRSAMTCDAQCHVVGCAIRLLMVQRPQCLHDSNGFSIRSAHECRSHVEHTKERVFSVAQLAVEHLDSSAINGAHVIAAERFERLSLLSRWL